MAPVRPEVDAIVLKCLEKNPSDRYQRVEDLLAALSDVAERFGSGTDSDTYERRAVGIYLETRFAGTDGAEADDAAVDDMDEILETAEDFLIASGFQVLFQTGEALLGVALIPEDPTAKDIERIHILDLTREMFRVATRAAPNTSVQVCVAIHIDRVSVRDIGHTQSIEGGDITCTTWVPQPPQAGVTPTPAFLRWSRGHDA
jgi:serine/threonine-protein kinase